MRASVMTAALLIVITSLSPAMLASGQNTSDGSSSSDSIYINEIYVSPNSEAYGGIDWNGDGEISRYSNQFVELHNPSEEAVDIGGWWIDDIADGGSPMCSIAWGTVIDSGAYLVFYRAQTNIEFDYFAGDTVSILDGSGSVVDSVSYEAEDSDYGVPYGYDSSGTWAKLSEGSPTPGGSNSEEWVGVNHLMGNCYPPQDHVHNGQYVLEGRVVTMIAQDDIIDDGRVLVRDGMIEAVWSSSEDAPAAAEGVVHVPTSGTIYPGFVDPHNHAKYNLIPLWDHGTDGWDNRYQWQSYSGYSDAKDIGCSLYDSSAMRFAELRAVAGGNTALQGSSTSNTDTFETMLARNIELYNFGGDNIWTKVTELESDYEGNHIKDGNSSGNLDAWFIHLAEGIDESSRAEFDVLVQNDLLVGEIVVIHGTGLTQPEFSALGDVGGSLAWSPTSNLLLYGETTDIATAKAEGVNIMIGPDWSPSGSKSSLHELKTADWWDENVLGDIFSDYELLQTITTNVVDAIGWSGNTGRIQEGLAADLVVLDTFEADPYRNAINAVDPDIRLVVVGGLPVFGDVDIMQAMDNEVEVIEGDGFRKATDITYDGVPEAQQTFAEMFAYLQDCNQGKSVPIEYLFTLGDDRYFDVLNRSLTFQKDRSIDLWSDYYDIELDENGHRVGGTVGGAEPIETNLTGNGNGGNNVPATPPPDLPTTFPTFGPRGGSIPHPTTIPEGIHIEECVSGGIPDAAEGEMILCGSILVVMQDTEECISSWFMTQFCNLEVADSFTVPGRICTDALVPSSNEDWLECRHDVVFVEVSSDEPSDNQGAEDTEEESWMDGPFYWVAIFVALAVIIGSVATINNNLRGRVMGDSGIEEE
ncbi:MAG: lamin tail domain-containing protein [Candidatus Thermoplasmatota archaeon]|nr:lamin tail domain-containing protein [Candidatus Thermoplasmatota archaeon]